jgi:D-arabinose 1-dehydrogenase-like Zn-dependent alcohol dehydrogenase
LKDKCVKFPFKFPPLGPKELRANVLYAGLCHSDVLTVREGWGPAPFPLAPGHEIIAEVSQVGSEEKTTRKVILLDLVLSEMPVKNADFAKKEEKNFVENAKILTLMVHIGEDMPLLFNNLQTFSSIYLKDLIWLKVLHFSVQGLPLFTQ